MKKKIKAGGKKKKIKLGEEVKSHVLSVIPPFFASNFVEEYINFHVHDPIEDLTDSTVRSVDAAVFWSSKYLTYITVF